MRQIRGIENGADQREAAARVGVAGQLDQSFVRFGIIMKPLRAADQSEIELVFESAHVRGQLVVIALGIVDQIAGVDLEETGQRHARAVGQMPALAALNLREISLTDGGPKFAGDRFGDCLLSHLAIEPAQGSFNRTEVTEFLADGHSKLLYQYCDQL